jgi:hypothetical protein
MKSQKFHHGFTWPRALAFHSKHPNHLTKLLSLLYSREYRCGISPASDAKDGYVKKMIYVARFAFKNPSPFLSSNGSPTAILASPIFNIEMEDDHQPPSNSEE